MIFLTSEAMDGLFKKCKNRPEEWLKTAADLRKSADILFAKCPQGWGQDGEPINPESLFVLGPASMLYGFALENAIKGCLIMQHGGFDAAYAAHKGNWKSHRLQALAEGTKLPITPEQTQLLRSAEALVRWAGRYPISLKREDFTLSKQLNADDDMPPILLDAYERSVLDPFYKSLVKALCKN